mgnify:CR=1 FL=1
MQTTGSAEGITRIRETWRVTRVRMRAQFEGSETDSIDRPATCCVEIIAPRTGGVLNLADDRRPEDLGIRVDLLPNDAIGMRLPASAPRVIGINDFV